MLSVISITKSKKIKSSLYSPYYAEACNELRGPFPRLSAWATQLRRNVATVASRWRHCVDLTGPGIEPQTFRTDSVRFATELTAGLDYNILYSFKLPSKLIISLLFGELSNINYFYFFGYRFPTLVLPLFF